MTPNVLLLHCHDLGRFLGCYGNPTVRTPALDRFADDAVRFTQAFCTAPLCSPSRASLFTGRWPHSNGVMGLTHRSFGWDLHPDERHLAEQLRDAGYLTSMIGAHHESLVLPDPQLAQRLGFDHVHTGGNAPVVAERASEQLSELAAGDRPFYLQVGFREPHRAPDERDAPGTMGFLRPGIEPDTTLGVTVPPYLHDDHGARAEVAELQGAVHAMDTGVGQVLERLRELDMDKDTVVLFTTDHGVALPRAKGSLYDPGIEVALLIRHPARGWLGGGTRPELVSNVDITPTVLDTVGIRPPQAVQGASFAPLLDGAAFTPRRETFAEITYNASYDPKRCIRTATHKLIASFSGAPAYKNSSQSWQPRSTPRIGATARHLELYDLAADPHEFVNIVDEPDAADVRRDLLARLRTWMGDTADPLLDGAVTPPFHEHTLAALDQA